MEKKVEIVPAGASTKQGWWIIVLRDGLENRWPITWDELQQLAAEIKELRLP